MMTITTFEAAVTRAIVKLLLGSRKLKPGVVITGGDPLGIEDKIEMGRHAVETSSDLLHLEFRNCPTPALTGIALFLPRDGRCHIQSGCRLWLSKAGSRGLILPQAHVRGHFRLAPREIVHIDSKPADDLSEGIERASTWLTRQVTRPDIQYDAAQCMLWAQAA
ncbi:MULTISPECIES: hypothetical protein [unclassified Sphingomonas]|uniref:hypothetical protein n=1 Tax=unclassified Sphingomonas TaxID=196159 RepID=UPI00285987BC|nr:MULTISPECIES: hypothetical protein [unclassified Sphingomonas]MDR6116230.1 hypothetical protein [Sphingomonas sp. SORGH_AS_0789]MDR6150095.1 hypothetical protein [Sphingomonas sp. SORGH_AS_0742]